MLDLYWSTEPPRRQRWMQKHARWMPTTPSVRHLDVERAAAIFAWFYVAAIGVAFATWFRP